MMGPENLRDYQEDPRLEKVLVRLKRTPLRSRRQQSLHSLPGLLRAAALIALGVASGVAYERFLGSDETLMMRAEQLGASSTAASFSQAKPQRIEPSPRRSTAKPNQDSRSNAHKKPRTTAANGARSESPRPSIQVSKIVLDDESPQLPEFSDYEMEDIPAWRRHSEQGQFAEALSELEASGGFDAAFVDAASEELMLLADIARFAGRRGRAIQALRLLTETYFLSPQAPMAALTLGHLLSAAGDPASAREAYALNRRLSPGGEFAEDALVREFSLAVEALSLKQAQALFTQYQSNFPEGRQQDSLAEELARLQESLRQQAELQEDSESLVEDDAADQAAAKQGQKIDVNGEAGSDEGDSSDVEPLAPESDAPESEASESKGGDTQEEQAAFSPRAEADSVENDSQKEGANDSSADESSPGTRRIQKAATQEAPTPDNRSNSAP